MNKRSSSKKKFPARLYILAMVVGSSISANAAFGQGLKTADDYLDFGQLKEQKGQLDSALMAFEEVLSINANKDQSDANVLADDGIAIAGRDLLQLATGDLDSALINYRHDLSPDDMGFDVGCCYIWVIQNKKGKKQAADQELSGKLVSTASGMINLPTYIAFANFLLGKISGDSLIAVCTADDANTNNGQRDGTLHESVGMAYYFIGEKYFFAGNKVKAANYFNKIIATKHVTLDDFILAKAELKAMGIHS